MPNVVPPGSSLLRRVVVQLVGICVVATGVALTVTAEIGVAPYDVVTTGMHERLGMPLGLAAVLLPIVFLLGGLALGAKVGGRVGLGTLLDVILVGPVLGLVVDLLPELHALVPRIACYVVGFVGITVGIVLVIVPDLGAGPAEVLMLAIVDKGRPLAPVRTGIEVVCVLIGWAIGGQVGAGTLVFAALIGPALRRTLTAFGVEAGLAATRSDTASPGA